MCTKAMPKETLAKILEMAADSDYLGDTHKALLGSTLGHHCGLPRGHSRKLVAAKGVDGAGKGRLASAPL